MRQEAFDKITASLKSRLRLQRNRYGPASTGGRTVGVVVGAVEGAAANDKAIGYFTASSGTYSVQSIDWKDPLNPGLDTTSGYLTQSGSTWTVYASHNYHEEGSYTPTVNITGTGGALALSPTVVVSDAALTGSNESLTPQVNTPFTDEPVATFDDADFYDNLSDFSATIDWGDGKMSFQPKIEGSAGGPFTLSDGSHQPSHLPEAIALTEDINRNNGHEW